jgi:hypothetical protein
MASGMMKRLKTVKESVKNANKVMSSIKKATVSRFLSKDRSMISA